MKYHLNAKGRALVVEQKRGNIAGNVFLCVERNSGVVCRHGKFKSARRTPSS
jgi:hypothetical protein